MSELKDETKLLVAVGVWATIADGKIERMETSALINHIVNSTDESANKEAITEEISLWVSEFSDDFEVGQKKLEGKIKGCRNLSVIKDSLVDVAQRIIVADTELTDQEEVALARLHSWIGNN